MTNAPISGASTTAWLAGNGYDSRNVIMSRPFMKLTLGTAAVLVLLTAAASANVRLRPPGSIYVGIDLEVGGAPFAAKGAGECSYASDASIDRMPGQMWSVRQHDSAKDVSFTLWQLKQGGEMFTLNVTSGGTMHRVNTTHAGPASDHAGSQPAARAL